MIPAGERHRGARPSSARAERRLCPPSPPRRTPCVLRTCLRQCARPAAQLPRCRLGPRPAPIPPIPRRSGPGSRFSQERCRGKRTSENRFRGTPPQPPRLEGVAFPAETGPSPSEIGTWAPVASRGRAHPGKVAQCTRNRFSRQNMAPLPRWHNGLAARPRLATGRQTGGGQGERQRERQRERRASPPSRVRAPRVRMLPRRPAPGRRPPQRGRNAMGPRLALALAPRRAAWPRLRASS